MSFNNPNKTLSTKYSLRNLMWTQSRYTEGKLGTRFRVKKDILTKVTKDSVQYW